MYWVTGIADLTVIDTAANNSVLIDKVNLLKGYKEHLSKMEVQVKKISVSPDFKFLYVLVGYICGEDDISSYSSLSEEKLFP
jgi:hypothetical protein